jgi:hypothetical protein
MAVHQGAVACVCGRAGYLSVKFDRKYLSEEIPEQKKFVLISILVGRQVRAVFLAIATGMSTAEHRAFDSAQHEHFIKNGSPTLQLEPTLFGRLRVCGPLLMLVP